MSQLTCLTCMVRFTDSNLHRLHFKGDWHRYNLKRKVANLGTVTAEEFESRKAAHEAQAKLESGEVKQPGNYCIACRKNFKNEKAYDNHINSKKHKENLLNVDASQLDKVKEKAKSVLQKEEQMEEDEDEEIEEVDSDEWEEEGDALPVTECLFCPHHSNNLDKNVRHMTEAHSFFLPDPEYLVNLEGLFEYLGAKVGQGMMCLWCSERSKSFHSVDSVQKHMRDKGHCKLKHEGETLIEYAEYYDYTASYPDQEGDDMVEADQNSEVSLDSLDDSGFQLQLPSGATIGHRSLARYYRQSLNPNRALVPVDKSASGRLLSTYRSFGWTGTNRTEVVKKVRDIKFMNRIRNKSNMQLGWKANKLQTHFRDRNGMC